MFKLLEHGGFTPTRMQNPDAWLMAEALAKRTGKTKEQIKLEFPFEATLVVQGNQEDGNTIRSDSPTASLLSFNMVYVIAVFRGWIFWACDAPTAYLQSQGISRLLILRLHDLLLLAFRPAIC